MRKTVITIAIAVMVIATLATPASAAIRGERCHDHTIGGDVMTVCVRLNTHDSFGWVEAQIKINGAEGGSNYYLDFLKLHRNSQTPKVTQYDTWKINWGGVAATTDWASNCVNTGVDWQAEAQYKLRNNGQTSVFFDEFSIKSTLDCDGFPT